MKFYSGTAGLSPEGARPIHPRCHRSQSVSRRLRRLLDVSPMHRVTLLQGGRRSPHRRSDQRLCLGLDEWDLPAGAGRIELEAMEQRGERYFRNRFEIFERRDLAFAKVRRRQRRFDFALREAFRRAVFAMLEEDVTFRPIALFREFEGGLQRHGPRLPEARAASPSPRCTRWHKWTPRPSACRI